MSRNVLLCTGATVLALTIACSKSSAPTTSPSSATNSSTDANADGSTLKVSAPSAVAPSGGASVVDPIVLTGAASSGRNAEVQLLYQFQVLNGGAVVYDSGAVAAGTGGTVTHTLPVGALLTDTNHAWRLRPAHQGEVGSWSAEAAFRSPVGAFIRGNQVRDPLSIGSTVGEIRGPVQFIPGVGLQLLAHESHVLYRLPQNLLDGEISMLILGADEGSPGDKSKVFAAQEGPNEADLTDGDYRLTVELRGRNYSTPGAISCRIIPRDDEPRDCPRAGHNFNSSRWYFWRFSYNASVARLEVREDSETGRAIYDSQLAMHGSQYRPDPMYVYIGAPTGRAGALDATLPGGIYKNVYVGPSPRPAFPN